MRPVYEAIVVVALGLALVLLAYQTGYQQGLKAVPEPDYYQPCYRYAAACIYYPTPCYSSVCLHEMR